jgi:hypothetical protein
MKATRGMINGEFAFIRLSCFKGDLSDLMEGYQDPNLVVNHYIIRMWQPVIDMSSCDGMLRSNFTLINSS